MPRSRSPVSRGRSFKKAKHLARGDLIRTVDRSEVYCVSFAGGATLFGTGVVLSGIGGGAGITFAVAGGLVTAALNPLCGPAVARGILDYKTYRDPPVSSINVLARPGAIRLPKLPRMPKRSALVQFAARRARRARCGGP